MKFFLISLYPSLPLDKTIDVILSHLKNNFEDFQGKTKLTLKGVHQ